MNQTPTKPRWWQKSLTQSRFTWKEPKAYLHLKDKNELPQLRRRQPLILALFFGLFMSQWWLAKTKSGSNRMPIEEAIAIILPVSTFFAYGIPWLAGKCPSQIIVNDRMICRTRGSSNRRVEFKNLASFRWIYMQQWAVLRFDLKSGRNNSVAVPLEVSHPELDAFLQERGLRKEPDGHWYEFDDLTFLRGAT
ncbi:MAG TPA: hypothetical protein VN836_07230 [Verrucomicrobiae bacterium]|nr:hypothetical protein [Verrucomicrobiae bacterium]